MIVTLCTEGGFLVLQRVVQALLESPESLLHEVRSVREFLDRAQEVQVCLGDLTPRGVVHAVDGGPVTLRGLKVNTKVSYYVILC